MELEPDRLEFKSLLISMEVLSPGLGEAANSGTLVTLWNSLPGVGECISINLQFYTIKHKL
jgi:hypothetical protein